jgi:WD40 repeat protein
MGIVVIDELRICSCSTDKTIRVWNLSTALCKRILEGHKAGFRMRSLEEDYVVRLLMVV